MDIKARETLIRKLVELQVDRMMDEGWFRTCMNCEYFDEPKEWCTRWHSKPPVKVIVIGCEDHSDNIPF